MNNICATKNGHSYTMCKHCSSALFNNNSEPYWKCNKYNKILKDNSNKFLTKCKECINNN